MPFHLVYVHVQAPGVSSVGELVLIVIGLCLNINVMVVRCSPLLVGLMCARAVQVGNSA